MAGIFLNNNLYFDKDTKTYKRVGLPIMCAANSAAAAFLSADGSHWGTGQLFNLGIPALNADTIVGSTSSPVLAATAFSNIENITLGSTHGIAKTKYGTFYAWGSDQYGQLAMGTRYSRSSPVSIVGNHSFIDIVSNANFTLALKADGSVWAWGSNTYGCLGIGSIYSKSSPVSVIGNHSFVAISNISSNNNSGALKADGSAWCWGYNKYGQLGDNSTVSKSSPVSVVGNHSFVQISISTDCCGGLKADGTVWCWGYNPYGNLGDNTRTNKSSPVSVVGNHSFIKILIGSESMALKADGTLWAWGNNTYGSLGIQTITSYSSPVSVVGDHSFVDIACSGNHAIALKADGSAWAWGYNAYGQLGINYDGYERSPVSVVGNHSFTDIANAQVHTIGLKTDGSVWAWGQGGTSGSPYLCEATGTILNRSSPVSMIGNHSFIKIYNCPNASWFCGALKSDNTAWMWGANGSGQLGDQTVTTKSSPVSVVGNHNFVKLALSGAAAAGIKSDGTIWCWGNNGNGQLGDNTKTNKSSPVSVVGDFSFIDVVAANAGFFALKSDGTIWCWGGFQNLSSGTGATASYSSPVQVLGSGYTYVSSGFDTGYALKADGSMWAWGYSANGLLGDGDPVVHYVSSPQSVIGNHSFIAVYAGSRAGALMLKADGSCWALAGERADHACRYTFDASPVSIPGNISFVRLNSGYSTAAGTTSTGAAWMWGYNYFGYCGNNNEMNRSSPISVVGNHSFVKTTASTYISSCIKADGSVWNFGYNLFGQLGDNSTSNRSSPALIAGNFNFIKISISANNSFYLDNSGTAWGAGSTANGQLGLINRVEAPIHVGANSYLSIQASHDSSFTLALKGDGTVWGWGQNDYGQLGNNSIASTISPVQVVGGHSFIKICAGYIVSAGLKSDGSAWCWGMNTYGSCGDNTLNNTRSSPVSVVGNIKFKDLFVDYPSAGIDTENNLWMWGYNQRGNCGIGDGTALSFASPIQTLGGVKFRKVVLDSQSTLALDINGGAWGWGAGDRGQCGTGLFNVTYSSPVSVVGNHTFIDIHKGTWCSFGVKSDGSVWGWGWNNYGDLGDNTRTSRNSPVRVQINYSSLRRFVDYWTKNSPTIL